jgi:hypothetical protein
MLPPGLDEIVLVEPQGDGDRVPEMVEIRFAEDLHGPTRLRCRDDGPGDGTAQDHFLSQRLSSLSFAVTRLASRPRRGPVQDCGELE